jgi:hypothetical protein
LSKPLPKSKKFRPKKVTRESIAVSTSDFIFESEAAYSNKNSQKANILSTQ